MLAGASGSTGETGASGQTGLTGGLRLWHFIADVCKHGKASVLSTEDEEGCDTILRDCECLQGPAAPQARPGPLGRRVSQVGSRGCDFTYR